MSKCFVVCISVFILTLLSGVLVADEVLSPGSSVPPSKEAFSEQQGRALKLSVKPAIGTDLSSVPTCLTGAGCAELDKGGRVKFWFVGLQYENQTNCQGDCDEVSKEKDTDVETELHAAGVTAGLLYLRRIGHGYYELRNVIGISGRMDDERSGPARENSFGTRLGVQGEFDNSAYYAPAGDDVINHPFSFIFGGKIAGRSFFQGHMPRAQIFTGALQLSSGVVFNLDGTSVRATLNYDAVRTSGLKLRDDEDTRFATQAFRGGSGQISVSNTFLTLNAEIGIDALDRREGQELSGLFTQIGADVMLRIATRFEDREVYRGVYAKFSMGLRDYGLSDMGTPDRPAQEFDGEDRYFHMSFGYTGGFAPRSRK